MSPRGPYPPRFVLNLGSLGPGTGARPVGKRPAQPEWTSTHYLVCAPYPSWTTPSYSHNPCDTPVTSYCSEAAQHAVLSLRTTQTRVYVNTSGPNGDTTTVHVPGQRRTAELERPPQCRPTRRTLGAERRDVDTEGRPKRPRRRRPVSETCTSIPTDRRFSTWTTVVSAFVVKKTLRL